MIKIKRYFMWAGGIIIMLTIMVSILLGLYSDYSYCSGFDFEDLGEKPIPSTTLTEEQVKYIQNIEIKMKCDNVNSNIYITYLVIIIGIALLVSGFITEKLR